MNQLSKAPEVDGESGESVNANVTHMLEALPVSTDYFRVGTPVQLTVHERRQVMSEYSVILGYRAARFFLVELPLHDGRAMVIKPGTSVRVRYLLDGRLLGFSTETLKVQASPERLMFLRYPGRIEQLALRRHERVRVRLPTLMRLDDVDSAIDAETRDLSLSGCGLVVSADGRRLTPGAGLTVYFRTPGTAEMLKARAWTRMVKERRDGTAWVGCEFDFRPGEEETKTMVERVVLARTGMMSTSDLELE